MPSAVSQTALFQDTGTHAQLLVKAYYYNGLRCKLITAAAISQTWVTWIAKLVTSPSLAQIANTGQDSTQ